MAETSIKKKVPLISVPYYKELLRELRTICIVFAVIEAVRGLLAGFGDPLGGLTSLMTAGLLAGDLLILYFLVCGVKFLAGHLSRGSWDFRGSLPLAKKTMAATYILAVLTYGAVVFAARFLGIVLGELIVRISGMELSSIPAALGAEAFDMFTNLLTGLSLYCLIMAVGSSAHGFFSRVAAVAAVLLVPTFYLRTAEKLSDSGYSIGELFLPIGMRGRALVEFIVLVLITAAAVVVAIFAYSNARAETANKPARTRWLHVLIGLGFSLIVGLFVLVVAVSISRDFVLEYAFEVDSSALKMSTIIGFAIAVLLMLITYTAYMAVTLKSFKAACKRLMFFPIALLVLFSVIPLAHIAKGKWNRIDFSANNIKSVSVIDGTVENYSSQDYGSTLFEVMGDHSSRGRSGAEKVAITDPELIKNVSEIAELLKDNSPEYTSARWLIDRFGSFFGYSLIEEIEVTLNDGTIWSVPVDIGFFDESFASAALENKEYIEKFASMDRFSSARIFIPGHLGRDFEEVFFEELRSLSPEDRAAAFSPVFTNTETNWYGMQDSDLLGTLSLLGENNSIGTVTIVSPTYDNVIGVRITNKMPRSYALYLEKVNELSKSWEDYDEFERRLENCDFVSFSGSLADGMIYLDFNPNDPDLSSSERSRMEEACRILADALKRDTADQNAGILVKFPADSLTTEKTDDSGRTAHYFDNYHELISSRKQFYIRLTPEECIKLWTADGKNRY